jgi:hypothetical protein
MKCNTCGKEFNEGFLHEVVEHEHLAEPILMEVHSGKCISKKYGKDYESQSANILKIAFDDKQETFDITFLDEKTYRYFDVPRELFDEAIKSPSIGAFINRNLKGAFRYAYIN